MVCVSVDILSVVWIFIHVVCVSVDILSVVWIFIHVVCVSVDILSVAWIFMNSWICTLVKVQNMYSVPLHGTLMWLIWLPVPS